jgi:hypothetical protein
VNPVLDLLNGDFVRELGYGLAATVCLLGWRSERRAAAAGADAAWPALWLSLAAMVGVLMLVRLAQVQYVFTDLGREEARESGLYDLRRLFQVGLIGGLALAWCAAVMVAAWRVPARRRRYLPAIAAASAIIGFAGVRAISLHHIDAVLYNHPLAGLRIVVLVEFALLAGLAAAVLLAVRRRGPGTPRAGDRRPEGNKAAARTAG